MVFRTFFILLFSIPALAWPPTIGPELTFESPITQLAWRRRVPKDPASYPGWQAPTKDGEMLEAVRLKEKILKNCPECVQETTPGKFQLGETKITFPNGFWIVISVDPAVVELQTPALPFEKYRELAPFIQKNIYDLARTLNLKPKTNSDGHLNIGVLSAFPTVKDFARFLQDQMNHPELALGILGMDLYNGPPLAIQDIKQKLAFQKIMEDVENEKIKTHKELADRINSEVYYRSREHETLSAGRHYQGVGIKRLSRNQFPEFDMPLELRYPAGQASFERVLLMYELILKRIEYLNALKDFNAALRDPNTDVLKMTPREKLSRFSLFLEEMGEKFETYESLILDPKIRKAKRDSFAKAKYDWSNGLTLMEILEYIPEVPISKIVEKRFAEILQSSTTPTEVKEELKKRLPVIHTHTTTEPTTPHCTGVLRRLFAFFRVATP